MITEIGRHRVKCGDIMDGIDDLMAGDLADFIYSDPPWGQGNLRYWQTINHRHNGAERREIDFDAFLARYFEIIGRYARDAVILEYGCRWEGQIREHACDQGFHYGGFAEGIYSADDLPLHYHVFSRSGRWGMIPEFQAAAMHLKGFKIVERAFDYYAPPTGIVLDPMCGMGYTAQAAVNRGLTFRGNELNAKRLAKTINRLGKEK